ncbi:hypothetical protein ASPBRDRAFT_359096 [Aspergillus brasiliensis CBS 101740]|uniref:Uncharacterized protein n=1 Tax=Aspergillus brasiliensis (strain CBS 101740 / IMI 381727 / IBT 21946) TaxID=767769 RepID=A0A1L9U5Q9_ASPBC|nr:hypothetical protein ASPBRDRAFT_359096 [Aspergillus brasiliensis CBS 101740]
MNILASCSSDSQIIMAASEYTPLLGPPKVPQALPSPWRVVALICFVVLVQDFAEYLSQAPQTEVWLEIVIRKFCPAGQDGPGCQMDRVQREVALLQGWKDTLEQIPGEMLPSPIMELANSAKGYCLRCRTACWQTGLDVGRCCCYAH